MEEDKDKFAPLQKLLQDDAPIAGSSKEPSSSIYKDIEMEDMEISECSDEDSTEEKPKKKRTVGVKLAAHLKALMGEANLRFARGKDK